MAPTIAESPKLHVVLGNGGVRVLACVGALCELEARGYQFGSTAGCSAGTLVGALIAGGLSADRIRQEMLELDFRKAAGKPRFPGLRKYPLASLWPPFALYAKSGFPEAFCHILGGDRPLRDLQLPFAAGAVDINNLETLIYTSRKHGDLLLQEVLERAVAVPGLYPAIMSGTRMIVDGAFATQLNLTLSAVTPPEHLPVVLTCHVHRAQETPNSLHEYLARAIEASVAVHDRFVFGEAQIESGGKRVGLAQNVWWINISCPPIPYDKFGLSLDEKLALIDAGRNAVRHNPSPGETSIMKAIETGDSQGDEARDESINAARALVERANITIHGITIVGHGNVVGVGNQLEIDRLIASALTKHPLQPDDGQAIQRLSEAMTQIPATKVARSTSLEAAAELAKLAEAVASGNFQKQTESLSRVRTWWLSLEAQVRSGLALASDIAGVGVPIVKLIFGQLP